MKKKLKSADISFNVTYELHNKTLVELTKMVNAYAKLNPKHKNWRFITEYGYESLDIRLVADRLETTKELNARIKRSEQAKKSAKKRKLKRELEERELLEKLRSKYGVKK